MPLIKAAIEHQGAAFIDVISPCVAFNNHAGSTKSFDYVREHNEAVNRLDFITGRAPITVDYAPGTVEVVEQHDGSKLVLRKLAADYDAARPARRDELPAAATPPRARSSPGCSTSTASRRTCTAISTRSTRRSTRSPRRSCARARRRWRRSTPACGNPPLRSVGLGRGLANRDRSATPGRCPLYPESGHRTDMSALPIRAKTGCEQSQQRGPSFDHLVSAQHD